MGARGVCQTDADGTPVPEAGEIWLPTPVWSDLYDRVTDDPRLPLLRRIWQDQWGPEGDVRIDPDDLPALRAEAAALLAALASAPAGGAGEGTDFLRALDGFAADAAAAGRGLLFVAD
ncbi:hypothetical protein [Rhodospirillum centenum]|uniref:Uncharacterized protein n=1 Tax=Rhodospirillum centenum (strain ATCC 51521 / SW) TaxID=414684 RepID=B6IVL1_RHOCS|nr:hypothetical protein [Rhodospirillum centenum]ACJ00335.1 hypothetical protein RC1_2967 [Rhodospirillum centenum SW]